MSRRGKQASLQDFVLIALSTLVLLLHLVPGGETRQEVFVRMPDGTLQRYCVKLDDPILASNFCEYFSEQTQTAVCRAQGPTPDRAELVAQWREEVSRFYTSQPVRDRQVASGSDPAVAHDKQKKGFVQVSFANKRPMPPNDPDADSMADSESNQSIPPSAANQAASPPVNSSRFCPKRGLTLSGHTENPSKNGCPPKGQTPFRTEPSQTDRVVIGQQVESARTLASFAFFAAISVTAGWLFLIWAELVPRRVLSQLGQIQVAAIANLQNPAEQGNAFDPQSQKASGIAIPAQDMPPVRVDAPSLGGEIIAIEIPAAWVTVRQPFLVRARQLCFATVVAAAIMVCIA